MGENNLWNDLGVLPHSLAWPDSIFRTEYGFMPNENLCLSGWPNEITVIMVTL